MATYVVSDVHGHLKALDEVLSQASPADEDVIYMLGDMVDRGPQPLDVMTLCRSTPNMRVLLGNHEQFMLDALADETDEYNWMMWGINGAKSTLSQLATISQEDLGSLVEWVGGLPLYDVVTVDDRLYVLVHAGIKPLDGGMLLDVFPDGEEIPSEWDEASLRRLLAMQTRDDLLWIRDEFWGQPTGLLDDKGDGPVVIAGHTPTVVVEQIANGVDRPAVSDESKVRMIRCGGTDATAGVADKIATDCGAGSVPNYGQVLVLRLDDMSEFYSPVREGE